MKQMRMKKWIIMFLCMILCMMWAGSVSAEQMKIHVIHLKDNKGNTAHHGDAVLLESQGEFLLMDTGRRETYNSVINYLRKWDVKKLDIYISHMHDDHTGGLRYITYSKYFKVNKIYLPAKKFGASESSVNAMFNQINSQKHGAKLVYLQPGSQFSVGDARIKVLGPVGSYNHHKMRLTDFKNSNSLTSMVICGKVRFLTAGDTTKIEEAKQVAKYGKVLRAQILKVSHHGGPESTSKEWIEMVRPEYAVVSNRSINSGVKKILSKYAKVKVTGYEKKAIIYVVRDGKITVK